MSASDHTTPVEYRELPEFPGYRIGSDGSVWSCRKSGKYARGVLKDTWRELKPALTANKRYRFVSLSVNGKLTQTYVHRLVALAFLGECPDGMQVAHENGNGLDNRACNIRYDTHAGNMADKFRHGTVHRGEQIVQAKITEDMVRTIRLLADEGQSLSSISRQTGVSLTTVFHVARRRTWKHVI